MNKLATKAVCNIEANTKCEITGVFQQLHINNNGTLHLILKDLTIEAVLSMLVARSKGGQSYWKPKNLDHKYEFNDAVITLDNGEQSYNLINQAIQMLLKDNPKAVIAEVAPEVVKKMIVLLMEQLKHFFHHQPLSDLVTNAEYQ